MPTSTGEIVALGTPPVSPDQHPGRYVFVRTGSALCQVIHVNPTNRDVNIRYVCDGWGDAYNSPTTSAPRTLKVDEYLTVKEMLEKPNSIINDYDDCLTNMREYLLSRMKRHEAATLCTVSIVQDLLVICALTGNHVPSTVNVGGRNVGLQERLGTWLDNLAGADREEVIGRFTEKSSVRKIFDQFDEWGFVSRLKEEMICTADALFAMHDQFVVLY